MPYETLPSRYRDLIPARNGQDIFRNVLNSQLAAGKSEEVAFASAWAALQRAGYEKNPDGKWVEKTQPGAGAVHTPGTDWGTEKASGAEPVYAYRPVLNAEALQEWAAKQGFASALLPDDMHVTVVFSRTPFSADVTRAARAYEIIRGGNIVVSGGKRAVVPLGDKGAVVLKIECAALQYEHMEFRAMGASWDYQEYTPHITITYRGGDTDPRAMQPFTGDIVLGPLRAKPLNSNWDSEITEVMLTKAEDGTYKPPQGARNNARRVLGWKAKYGSEVKGMTSVGWARARQLASGKPISRATVARMSAFNRHRKNAAVAPEHKSAPWKDASHVAWLGWGGTTGIDWARRIMRGVAKRMLNDDTFTTREEAMARSYDLGLEGAIHVHQTADGQATYMPGEDHEAYLEQMAMRAGLEDYEDDEDEMEAEDDEAESDDLLERVISAIVQAVTKGDDMEQTFVKTADVIKVDGERRIAWGWASVSTLKGETVVDRQGDVISPVEMEKMADSFMASARTAKAMHEGAGVGEVLHSLPLTKALADALGIQTDREGWIIGMKIHDDKTWEMFKSGALAAFSIGGKAKRKVIE